MSEEENAVKGSERDSKVKAEDTTEITDRPGFRRPDQKNIEKLEEAKLRSKYGPALVKPGGSVFLQKQLQRRQKYFDSGEYNMAKSMGVKPPRLLGPQTETGGVIPTPDTLPTRKPSLVQSKLATGMS